jgi:polyhydroxyalkanoate synthesis repressor PhaR
MAQKTVLIRKYENRRLYDATNSRYVNLEEVAQLLRDGFDVRVVDVASGNDITRLILTQIIVEDAKVPGSAFPLDLLRQMIISSGEASQETALRYMKTMFDFYQDTYRAISPAVNPFSFFAGPANGPTTARPAAPPQTEPKAEVPADATVELKQRVEQLEKMVSSLSTPKKKASRTLRRR